MRVEKISVDNLKCSGCAATIRKALMEINGVGLVEVDQEKNEVEAEVEDFVVRSEMISKLSHLGYPEKGTGNMLQKGISYVSCMIGRLGSKS